MTSETRKPRAPLTLGLRLALLAEYGVLPFARRHLLGRRARGKEDPDRWAEKLAQGQAERPDGPLVWLHGVGLGEVLALRGLVAALGRHRPDLHFLVTSSSFSAGTAIERNLPDRCRHQYLPLDLPGIAGRFLDHWRPDLAVWTDQEIWPRLAMQLQRRGIPQAMVAARLAKGSAASRGQFTSFYRGLYRLPDMIEAQDQHSAEVLGQRAGRKVAVTGSLKPAAAPLAPSAAHDTIAAHLAGRDIWLLASSHPADESIALAAQAAVCKAHPAPLLIIAPRDPRRGPEIAATAQGRGLATCLRTTLADIGTQVWVADSFGELGTWYRLARVALIGGSFDDTEGHNPWEAAVLDTAILHGPRTANFAADYARLAAAGAARCVTTAADVCATLADPGLGRLADKARAEAAIAAQAVDGIAARLIDLMEQG
ncbi:3-deoxy-D-manno-octulosonic acid transferase [Yoonia sp.]|uniref:3-deoxy-D-manno-octulosonic acid transferase n=1 Tax=Yoonia sp. TaxID=2212373 RepID=UPI002FD89D26